MLWRYSQELRINFKPTLDCPRLRFVNIDLSVLEGLSRDTSKVRFGSYLNPMGKTLAHVLCPFISRCWAMTSIAGTVDVRYPDH